MLTRKAIGTNMPAYRDIVQFVGYFSHCVFQSARITRFASFKVIVLFLKPIASVRLCCRAERTRDDELIELHSLLEIDYIYISGCGSLKCLRISQIRHII